MPNQTSISDVQRSAPQRANQLRRRQNQDIVVINDGEWRISYKGKLLGPYATETLATKAAIAAAKRAASMGQHSKVQIETRPVEEPAE